MDLNLGVTIGIVAGMIYIVILLLNNPNKANDKSAASIISALGVLGTFIGIFIGLYNFDSNNISTSVPALLDGMKTAFITSIIGMALSIGIKFVQQLIWKKEEEEENIDDIVELFNKMIQENRATNETLKSNQEQTKALFEGLGSALIMNQLELKEEIQSLNTSLSSKQDELIENFKIFGEQMAENNSQALIDALNNVIKDFNNKISEQFGENFKHLNKAVESLLVWQENYKEHIISTTNQLEQTVNTMTSVEESITNISDKSNVLVQTSESINETLIQTNEMNNNLKENVETLIDLSKESKEFIPNIDVMFKNMNTNLKDLSQNFTESLNENMNKLDKHMDSLTNDVSQTTAVVFEDVQKNMAKSNELFKEEVNNYLQDFKIVVDELNNCIPDVNEHLKQTNERFNNTLSSFTTEVQACLNLTSNTIQSQSELMKNTTFNINNQLEGIITDSTKRLEDITVNTSAEIKKIVDEMEQVFSQKVDQLDKLLESELTNALNSLGGQLITISDQFAKDYVPLANKLKEVVNISRGVM